MQCIKTYAATTIIANYLEIMPEFGRKLPLAAIAEWMSQNDIEPEDVLYTTPQAIKTRLARLIDHSRPRLPLAA